MISSSDEHPRLVIDISVSLCPHQRRGRFGLYRCERWEQLSGVSVIFSPLPKWSPALSRAEVFSLTLSFIYSEYDLMRRGKETKHPATMKADGSLSGLGLMNLDFCLELLMSLACLKMVELISSDHTSCKKPVGSRWGDPIPWSFSHLGVGAWCFYSWECWHMIMGNLCLWWSILLGFMSRWEVQLLAYSPWCSVDVLRLWDQGDVGALSTPDRCTVHIKQAFPWHLSALTGL